MEQQKTNWLSEHLPYEVKMLRYTVGKLQQLQDGSSYLEFNAMLIAFSTVACNLAAFLTNGEHGSNNFKAADFVGGFRSRKGNLQGAFAKLEPQVFHLGKDRPLGESGSKFQLSEAHAISEWIEHEMSDFIVRLPDHTLWRGDRATPEVDSADRFSTVGLRQQTCSSVGASVGTTLYTPRR